MYGMSQLLYRSDEGWSDWFRDMTVAFECANDDLLITTLAGPVADQAALRGILTRIWNLT